MKIIPWHCHVCGSDFETPDGGLCSRCSKATCRSCLIRENKKTQTDGKVTSGLICTQCATPEELKRAHPFKRFKLGNKARSVLKTIAIAVIFLLAVGFFVDLLKGFYVIRQSQSVYAGLAGLFIMAILYVLGEAGSDWIGMKDDVTHPLYKRVFHLFLLLLIGAVVLVLTWFALKSFGVIKV